MSARSRTPRLFSNDNRAVSTVVGTVIILSIIFFVVVGTAGIGIGILQQGQAATDTESASETMTQLDSNVNLVAYDGSEQYTTDLSTGSSDQIMVEEGGTITLELVDEQGDVNETIAEEDLGKVVYQLDGRHVAFQGGGVWRYDETEGVSEFISPPDFTLTNTTTTLPVTVINTSEGDREVDDTVTLTNGGSTTHFPDGDLNSSNPITGDDVRVTIQSQYYEAWGDYFVSRTDAKDVELDHSAEEVRFTLLSEGDNETTITTGVGAAGGDSSITVSGAGGGAFVDAYNSSEGSYADTQLDDGQITSTGGVDITSGGEVRGNVVTNGDLGLSGNSIVSGDAAVTGDVLTQGDGSEVQGEVTSAVDLRENPRANTVIASERESAKSNNDNTAVDALENNGVSSTLDTSQSPTFESGVYVTESLTVPDGDTVVFDLSDGNITLVVENDVDVSGDIEIVGNDGNDNRLETYVNGDRIVYDGGSHSVVGDESPASWMYSSAGTEVILENHADKTGVIYAPGSAGSEGTVSLETHSSLFGGVIGGDTTVRALSSVHYDQALRDEQVFSDEQTVVVANEVNYLYFSTTEIRVNEDS